MARRDASASDRASPAASPSEREVDMLVGRIGAAILFGAPDRLPATTKRRGSRPGPT